VSGFSLAAGSHGDPFDRKRDFGFATSHWRMKKRISISEYRLSNVEGRNSIEIYGFERQSVAIPSFNILRFDILLFCGSRFGHAGSHTSVYHLSSPTPETRHLKPQGDPPDTVGFIFLTT
jgi:hypothetical protein